MKKIFILTCLLFVMVWQVSFGQNENKSGVITYVDYGYGGPDEEAAKTQVTYSNKIFVIESIWPEGVEPIDQTPVSKRYVDTKNKSSLLIADFTDGHRISYSADISNMTYEMTSDSDQILGYECYKARTVSFSNTIEIWCTPNTGLQGAPSGGYWKDGALVMRMSVNGNVRYEAVDIQFSKSKDLIIEIPQEKGTIMQSSADFRQALNDSYITKVKIFDDEQICWGWDQPNPDDFSTGKTFHYAGGTILLKEIELPEVTDDYTVMARLTQYSNGDAYDRTGTVFVISEDSIINFSHALEQGVDKLPVFIGRDSVSYQGFSLEQGYQPLLELMRFFTPFGIKQYNDKVNIGIHWQDSTLYKQDVTSLLPALRGKVLIGVCIGNYDKGGHKVSLTMEYYPGEEVKKNQHPVNGWVCPLFNTVNIMEMAGQSYGGLFRRDSLSVRFYVPEGVENVALHYITTGHGGWGGGDEFNQRENTLLLDDEVITRYTPWRCDCAIYRDYNPASGNFWNGISSSDLSRSGWCPGTISHPVFIPLSNLKNGWHVIKVAIPQGPNEGNSRSAWCVSGVLTGVYK